MKLERENKIDRRHAVYSELPEDIKHKVIWGMGDYEGIMNYILGRIRMKPDRLSQYETG
jgi:hypothetical protein